MLQNVLREHENKKGPQISEGRRFSCELIVVQLRLLDRNRSEVYILHVSCPHGAPTVSPSDESVAV